MGFVEISSSFILKFSSQSTGRLLADEKEYAGERYFVSLQLVDNDFLPGS